MKKEEGGKVRSPPPPTHSYIDKSPTPPPPPTLPKPLAHSTSFKPPRSPPPTHPPTHPPTSPSSEKHGANRQSHGGGRAATPGPHVLLLHPLVRPISMLALPLLPLPRTGPGDPGWTRGDVDLHPYLCLCGQEDSRDPGTFKSSTHPPTHPPAHQHTRRPFAPATFFTLIQPPTHPPTPPKLTVAHFNRLVLLYLPINSSHPPTHPQRRVMAVKDERIKITNEAFNGIKILKLYAWEKPFEVGRLSTHPPTHPPTHPAHRSINQTASPPPPPPPLSTHP